MERIVSNRYRMLEYLLVANSFFWLIIGLLALGRYAILGKGVFYVSLVMSMEFVFYGVGLWMIHKRMAYSKMLIFILSFGTAILSLLDELGFLDIVSFGLSILVTITVISLWMAEKR